MVFNSRSYSILDLIPPLCNWAYQNLRSYSIISYSLDLIPPSSLSQQYRFYTIFNLDIHQMKMTNLNLNEFFPEMFPSERWIIFEPLLAKDECHGIAMAIYGPSGNVLTIGEVHWSLNTVTFFSATVSINILAFLEIIGGNNAFSLENSGGQPKLSR